jgi:predicted nucleic acid-binding protein
MTSFFDTSVLVPVFYRPHQHHTASIELFLKANRQNSFCGVHSLAEFYSTVTRIPGRVSGADAMRLIAEILERLTVVALDGVDYVAALEKSARLNIAGGSVYDSILAASALKSGADVIYAWNARHYSLMGGDIVAKLRQPAP